MPMEIKGNMFDAKKRKWKQNTFETLENNHINSLYKPERRIQYNDLESEEDIEEVDILEEIGSNYSENLVVPAFVGTVLTPKSPPPLEEEEKDSESIKTEKIPTSELEQQQTKKKSHQGSSDNTVSIEMDSQLGKWEEPSNLGSFNFSDSSNNMASNLNQMEKESESSDEFPILISNPITNEYSATIEEQPKSVLKQHGKEKQHQTQKVKRSRQRRRKTPKRSSSLQKRRKSPKTTNVAKKKLKAIAALMQPKTKKLPYIVIKTNYMLHSNVLCCSMDDHVLLYTYHSKSKKSDKYKGSDVILFQPDMVIKKTLQPLGRKTKSKQEKKKPFKMSSLALPKAKKPWAVKTYLKHQFREGAALFWRLGYLFVLGGIMNDRYTNSLAALNFMIGQWQDFDIEGDENAPTIVSDPLVTYHPEKDQLFYFGGFSGKSSNQMHVLKFENSAEILPYWEKIDYKVKGSLDDVPRHRGAMGLYSNSSIIMHGGLHYAESPEMNNEQCVLNDLWIYSISKRTWKKIKSKNEGPKRYGHSIAFKDKYIFIYGGLNNQDKPCNDFFCFSLERKRWCTLSFHDDLIPKFVNHHAFFYENHLMLLGGKVPLKSKEKKPTTVINITINTSKLNELFPTSKKKKQKNIWD
eukprot:CAMPEP_0117420990 /NCGR_PEP_ID=MMETSP0758-20121206/2201_1 /TAXON_ID=63605 /ORGANISM="Percolomonas cosmopolitus, Strain AE-1 (ATCC 50343)" /LENGTH=634 /DNA_ID=CAMNT_0005202905 /DNA_START=295 /DNA_END=2196 /DNA_ORIENTATION=-